MALQLDLVYCAGGNPRLVDIAHEAGWLLGLRSDESPMAYPPMFIDIDYKKPDFERHLDVVARHKPKYATVPDLSEEQIAAADIDRALAQAERLKPHCQIVLLVPKLSGQLPLIPPDFAIGYSVPTSYGGAKYGIWKLQGRRIHLLGGSPNEQMKLYKYMGKQIISADGNYAQKIAVNFAKYWHNGKWLAHPKSKTDEKDLYFDCWKRSCTNLMQTWTAIASNSEAA